MGTYLIEQDVPEGGSRVSTPFPDPIGVKLSSEQRAKLCAWLDEQISSLESSHSMKMEEFAVQEAAYRARSLGPQEEPFIGACGDVVPLIAMAVDPILARLDTSIFKAKPVLRFSALRKSFINATQAHEEFFEYYQKHRLRLRNTLVPRLLELTKHGTMVLKVVYDCVEDEVRMYNRQWKVETRKVKSFQGPRITGVSLSDFFMPTQYQSIQDSPIAVERLRLTKNELLRAQAQGKVTGVERVFDQTRTIENALDFEQKESAQHSDTMREHQSIEAFECWFDYSLDGKKVERFSAIYHKDTQEFLTLRFNQYFHQKKPYIVIPYTQTANSLYGIGICEMVLAFQEMITSWYRHGNNNAFLANIRMYLTKKNAFPGEAKLKVFAGRNIEVDDPSKDFAAINAGADIYISSLQERQNIIGLAEKRTGVSDYLTGRESPIVGSRATATSTLALIQEGKGRVEEVLENIRLGLSEAVEMCIYIWIQYGLGDIVDVVFSGDKIAQDLIEFYNTVDEDNLHGAIAIDLAATDASNNKVTQQQTQLALINSAMQYWMKLIELGQLMVNPQTPPPLVELGKEVAESARKMFMDLYQKHDVRQADEYLPDLEEFIRLLGAQQGGQGAVPPSGLGGSGVPTGVPLPPNAVAGIPQTGPAEVAG